MAHIDAGRLVRLLEDWCQPFAGYHLYYPSRRQPSPAFALVVEAFRYGDSGPDKARPADASGKTGTRKMTPARQAAAGA